MFFKYSSICVRTTAWSPIGVFSRSSSSTFSGPLARTSSKLVNTFSGSFTSGSGSAFTPSVRTSSKLRSTIGFPSSITVKSPGFNPCMACPFASVTTTSRLTSDTRARIAGTAPPRRSGLLDRSRCLCPGVAAAPVPCARASPHAPAQTAAMELSAWTHRTQLRKDNRQSIIPPRSSPLMLTAHPARMQPIPVWPGKPFPAPESDFRCPIFPPNMHNGCCSRAARFSSANCEAGVCPPCSFPPRSTSPCS